ncbi:MAG TPA: SatD family protein [Planctomycetota bacterium]
MTRTARKPVSIALTGDLVASRAMDPSDRDRLQGQVLATLGELNGELGPECLAAPLTLTAGDEIQGLFRRSTRLVEAIQEITDRLFGCGAFPYLVFGLGRGPLTTGSVPAPPAQAPNPAWLDGPAFHHARAALETAQRKGVWACFEGFGALEDELLDALFALMGAVRSRWAAEQGRTSYEARRTALQKDLADRRQVSPSVVSESLRAANHRVILAGEEAARKLLASLEAR